jgi:hypothetical protein
MSIETQVELVGSQLIKYEEPSAETFLADRTEQDEDIRGIELRAAVNAVASHAAGNGKTVYDLTLSISIRSLIPDLDAGAVASLWEAIETAILRPTAPTPPDTWLTTITGLSGLSLWSAMGEVSSDRTDEDQLRRHARQFRILAALN